MKVAMTCLSILMVSACSNEGVGNLNSAMSSIAAPGAPGGPNTLYWKDQTDMTRATCVVDKPTTRENCTLNSGKLTIAEVTKRATMLGQGAVDAATLNIAAEIKALKDVDPTVVSLAQQIDALTKQKAALQVVITTDTKQIEVTTKEKAVVDEKIAADDQQLIEIAKQLQAKPDDPELLKLQAKVQAERNDLATQSAGLATRLQTIQRHLAWQQSAVIAVDTHLKARGDELKKTVDELVVYSPKLDQLMTAKSDAQASLTGINQIMNLIARGDITFHGNLLSAILQNSLTLVDRAFEPAMELKFGRYKVESGFSSFCAQKIEPVIQGGDVRIDITIQPPCNQNKLAYICERVACKNTATRYFTVMNATHYSYVEGSNKAVFVLDAAQ